MTQSIGYFQTYSAGQRPSKVHGMDVSHYQLSGAISFASAYAAGDRFVIFKAGGVFASTFSARYIKCTVNGSTTNSSSIFNEIKVYDINGNEYAAGKTVTGSQAVPQVGSYSNFTDGNIGTYVIVGDNTQWVQVDLGATISVYHIMLWHYAGRQFHNNKIEVSTDGVNYTTIFDSATAGEYVENQGLDIFKYGGMSKDAQFTAAHVASARAAGLKVGTYFFKNPNYYNQASGRWMNTTADASAQAATFYGYCTSVMGASARDIGDCFAMLDWENDQGNQYPSVDNIEAYDYISTFCNTFKTLSSGRQCGMYTAEYTIDNLTAITALHLCRSSSTAIGSVCPLWLSLIIDTTSAYPTINYQAWGYFASDLWTMWQYSYNNTSAAAHGMLGTALDLDLLEGAIETIMPPTATSGIAGHGNSTSITATWSTGETDVQGYYLKISGQATATVSTGVGSAIFTGLLSNTSYAINFNSFDMWEISETTSVTVNTTGAAAGGHGTLLCFKIPS